MKKLILASLFVISAFVALACAHEDVDTPSLPSELESMPTPQVSPRPTEASRTSTPPPTPESSRSSTPTPEATLRSPQPIPRIQTTLIDPYSLVSPSIDQQILDARAIVVASLVSATAAVQTIPGDPGVASTFRPMQVLRFRANQYLKGEGPAELTVEVLDSSYGIEIRGNLYSGYLTEVEAMEAAQKILARRNTTWDDRPRVLFLEGSSLPSSPSDGATGTAGGRFGFVQSNNAVQSSFQYSVDSLSRTWLPANETPSNGAVGVSDKTEFITDGAEAPPPVVALSALKTRIGEIEAMLAAGEGIKGYEKCVYNNLIRERWFRASPERRVHEIELTIESGLGAESLSLDEAWGDPFPDPIAYHDDYHEFWYTGLDAEHFTTIIEDDDNIASNGYRFVYTIARPLPEGEYNVNFHIWAARDAICMNKPADGIEEGGYTNYNVTVVSPPGTLHEAFFDPNATGADELSDGEFPIGGVYGELTSLDWNDGKIILSLESFRDLAGYRLDVIRIDGSISPSLSFSDAVKDQTANTYSWDAPSPPWQDGDMLMLRIREDDSPVPVSTTDNGGEIYSPMGFPGRARFLAWAPVETVDDNPVVAFTLEWAMSEEGPWGVLNVGDTGNLCRPRMPVPQETGLCQLRYEDVPGLEVGATLYFRMIAHAENVDSMPGPVLGLELR